MIIKLFLESTQNQRCFNVEIYRRINVDKSTFNQRGYHVDRHRDVISTYICWECTEYTFRIYILLNMKKHYFIHFFASQQTFLAFQDVFKTSSRRLQCNNLSSCEDIFRTPHLQDAFARHLQKVFKTSSSRRHQDVFKKTSCNYVLKTSWKTKKCYTKDVFKTSSVRLHQDKCLLCF